MCRLVHPLHFPVLRRVITKRTTCYLRGMTLEDFNHMVDFEALVHDDHDGTVVHAPQHRDRSIVVRVSSCIPLFNLPKRPNLWAYREDYHSYVKILFVVAMGPD